jgi:iron complex outermembrane receptor protein
MKHDASGDSPLIADIRRLAMNIRSRFPAFASVLMTAVQAQPAGAQQTSSESANDTAVQEVVIVTCSRLDTSSGFAAPTPVAVVGADELQAVAPGSLAAALNSLPQFQGSRSPSNAGQGFAAANGANLLNLRNLGPQRNLVLLDGRRMISSTDVGAVDINLLPRDLVKQVEVVTGGASAAYGSDALSGVVNFVLDKQFTGIRTEVLGGLSQVGDGGSYGASLSGGSAFGERGHVIFSGEIYSVDDIPFYDASVRRRDWVARSWGRIPNPAGSPRALIVDDVRHSNGNYAGLITAGPLRGTTFGPGGAPQPFNYGALVSSTYMQGGDGPFPYHQAFTSGVERWNLFAHADYDVTDSVTVFLEAQAARTRNETDWFYDFATGQFGMTIFRDNAFLPASLGTRMDQLGVASFPLGRYNTELLYHNEQDTRMDRVATGFEGRFGSDWSYDAYYSHGWTDWVTTLDGNKDLRKFYAAVDAVMDPATGRIVCRSTLAGLDPGCVPFNPFGVGSPSPESLDYISGRTFRDAELEQDFFAFTLRGSAPLFAQTRAALAAGVEYRKESATETSDEVSQSRIDLTGLRGAPPQLQDRPGGWLISNPQPQGGSYDVKEAFVEVGLPLLKDLPLVEQLDLNASLRRADYSGTGPVDAWKIGATYAPIDSARLRVTRSRDVRAPNILERFAARQTFGLNFVTDPATGAQIPYIGVRSGNPELGAELGDTWTIGLVLQPAAIAGLSFSVDYYDIDIDDAISSLSPQLTVDQCAQGVQLACDNIVESNGTYTIFQPFLNLDSQTLRGVDVELGYSFALASGQLAIRLFVNDRLEATATTPGAAHPTVTTDAAGKVQGKLTLGYEADRFSIFVQERYIGGGLYNTQFKEGVDIDDNSLPAVWYTDLTGVLKLGESELFLTVNNLLNEDPPPSPAVSTFQDGADRALYDFIGRYYTLGMRWRL